MKLSFKWKLIVLVLVSATLPLLLYLVQSFFQSSINSSSKSQLDELKQASLQQIASDVYTMCQTANALAQQRNDYNLSVARDILSNHGKILISDEKVRWTTQNQFTKAKSEVILPKMLIGTVWLGQNRSFLKPTPVVDKVKNLVGGTCTIFQQMNELGDMLRVATNVENPEGERAIGTFIPSLNPDGSPNEVIRNILTGKPYRGRAYVVNDWYLTSYEPIWDSQHGILGMLYVGLKQESIEVFKENIRKINIGKTGYVFILSAKGEDKGKLIISGNDTLEEQSLLRSPDKTNIAAVKTIINSAIKLKNGKTTIVKYDWKGKNSLIPHKKIAAVAYFEPWDWVIGVTDYENSMFK